MKKLLLCLLLFLPVALTIYGQDAPRSNCFSLGFGGGKNLTDDYPFKIFMNAGYEYNFPKKLSEACSFAVEGRLKYGLMAYPEEIVVTGGRNWHYNDVLLEGVVIPRLYLQVEDFSYLYIEAGLGVAGQFVDYRTGSNTYRGYVYSPSGSVALGLNVTRFIGKGMSLWAGYSSVNPQFAIREVVPSLYSDGNSLHWEMGVCVQF